MPARIKHHTWRKKVKSLAEFFRTVQQIEAKWRGRRGEFRWPWFRGHPDTRFKLEPSAYREGRRFDEDSVRNDFRLKAFPFLKDSFYKQHSEWDYYFLLQHHGAPTRLLDWTEGSLIALYFALRDATDDADCAVWMMDPFEFNKLIPRTDDAVLDPTDEYVASYLPEPFETGKLPKRPVAFQPMLNSPRMVAQKSVFTVHGSSSKPLEEYEEIRDNLIKIEIDYRERNIILHEELPMAGLTESNIYPDLPALCRELKLWWQG